MNPILQSQLASLVRSLMWLGVPFLVKKGLLTGTQAEGIVEAASLMLVSLAWSYWKNHANQVKVVTALAMPAGSTENDLKAQIITKAVPSVLTPANQPPEIPAQPPK
jgi:hypothetical protein